MTESERDNKIDEFVVHFGNSEAELALEIAEDLSASFPEDPYFNILKSRAIGQLIKNKILEGYKLKNIRNGPYFQELSTRFYAEIDSGLKKLEGDNSVKGKYLRGVLLGSKGTFVQIFIAEFNILSPIKSRNNYQAADKLGANGLELIMEALEEDPSLCPAKFVIAKTKYEMSKLGFVERTIISNSNSLTFKLLGRNFDVGEAWDWINQTYWCASPYYYQKEINWDKIFVYKEMTMDYCINGNLDKDGHKRLLEILDVLCNKFPKNNQIRKEKNIVEFHLDRF